LDRLQKDAQASELDFTNTSPATFVILGLIQVPVTQAIAYLISPHFQHAALLCIGSHWLGFLLSCATRTNWFYDVFEDVSLFAIILWSYLSIEGQISTRQKLAFSAALIWNARLLGFLGYRIIVRGSDFRFDKLIKAHGYNFFGWTSGGTWCFLNCFCLWMITESFDAHNPLGVLDYLGLLIWVSGLLIETTADIQKYIFNSKHESGANKQWIATGLWKYSRHPNYFGENLSWAGLAVVCVGGWPGLNLCSCALAAVSPLWSVFFLVFTSLMLLEKRADKKWGGQPAYEKYKCTTSVLVPWF